MTRAGRPARGRLAPEAMYPAGEPDVCSRRVRLASGLVLRVAESGDPAAPPVVLLHGWGASLYMWHGWFAPLVAAGYRVLAVDLPGHGLSDKPADAGAYTLARQVALLADLFGREGLAGARVVAQSMAGTLALELALGPALGPAPLVSRLALVNPAAFGRVRLQRLARLASPRVLDPLLARVTPRWIVARAHRLAYADGARVTSRDVDEYWAPSADPAFSRAMRQYLREFEWRRTPVDRMAERLARLTAPTFIVVSGRDHLVRDAGPYVTALQRAGIALDVLHVPDGGHAVNEEEPERILPRVLDFLR